MTAEETKRAKARQLRYKKPIAKNLNLQRIKETLWEIQEGCEEVHWWYDTDEETLLNALDGNEDEAQEFKMMFASLCADCEQMRTDLEEQWVPECFDTLFVTAGAGKDNGGLLGWDYYEQDYFDLDEYECYWAESEAMQKLKKLTKNDLIAAMRQCFRVYSAFIALQYRYDCLKTALDILKDQNTEYLKLTKQINDLYDEASKENFSGKATIKLESFCKSLPQEAWIQ